MARMKRQAGSSAACCHSGKWGIIARCISQGQLLIGTLIASRSRAETLVQTNGHFDIRTTRGTISYGTVMVLGIPQLSSLQGLTRYMRWGGMSWHCVWLRIVRNGGGRGLCAEEALCFVRVKRSRPNFRSAITSKCHNALCGPFNIRSLIPQHPLRGGHRRKVRLTLYIVMEHCFG